jgi:bifunctional non-homologous end joining protein LigD
MPDARSPTKAPLARYKQKRDFAVTPEPAGDARKPARGRTTPLSFVIQKHWASRLHYDFRLELDGVLLSWAVPKGPSYDPTKKQMAIHVEDHPLEYAKFEGTIPAKQYGAGTVITWDRGTWEPVGDPREGMRNGKLLFKLHGEKLAGLWELVRISKPGDKQDQWMLFKKRDEWARPHDEYDVITALPDSVAAKPLGLIEAREPRAPARKDAAAAAAPPRDPDLTAARTAPLPAKLEPQLATAISSPPAGDWIVETKFDGYRLMARIESGKARLFTRGGHDWTSKMRSLAAAIEALDIASAWLDGEIVVMSDKGVPDFNALQNALDSSAERRIEYFVFDLPYLDGKDLRKVPLRDRREVLRRLLDGKPDERVHFSADFDATPAQMLEAARQMQLEGVMLKRPDAPYVSARTETWLKLKAHARQEFVICGFVPRAGSAGEVGSLLLGYYDGRTLTYAGNVGTGWDSATARDLYQRLSSIEIDEPHFDAATIKPGRWSRRGTGGERWVKPALVAEVSFAEWTPEGRVRHAVFQGLRLDMSADAVGREVARPAAPAGKGGSASQAPVGVKVTHPERVIDPSTGLTKLSLVRYYESIADRMLPHLHGRPVSLVRAPEGVNGELFFQKHMEARVAGLVELDAALWPGHASLIGIESSEALLAAAQMNTVEFHTWNSTTRSIDRPDRMIFDLDPGAGVEWPQVKEGALLTRALLSELSLESWLKTSGGKGLHVVVPLAARLDYDVVKSFSQAIVQHLARTIPQRFVARSGASNRLGRIFVDYLRNGHGQTTAAAFSARARPGLGVSMPIAWEQLATLKSGAQWTIATAREYLSFQQDDPWAGYWSSRQTLTAAMKTLGFKRPAAAGARG